MRRFHKVIKGSTVYVRRGYLRSTEKGHDAQVTSVNNKAGVFYADGMKFDMASGNQLGNRAGHAASAYRSEQDYERLETIARVWAALRRELPSSPPPGMMLGEMRQFGRQCGIPEEKLQ